MELSVVILAAGQGTRMRSSLPKILHPIAGKPLVQHVVDTARSIGSLAIHLVYGHGGDLVKQTITGDDLNWVMQAEQLGTGHAVQQVVPDLNEDTVVLILYGDVPLIKQQTLDDLLASKPEGGIALLTVALNDPTGYGRIVRNSDNEVSAIVEHKDAEPKTLLINEVNTGIMAVAAKDLKTWLGNLSNENAQGEYYLTDIIAMASDAGRSVVGVLADDELEVEGVNNRQQLARLERHYQKLAAEPRPSPCLSKKKPATSAHMSASSLATSISSAAPSRSTRSRAHWISTTPTPRLPSRLFWVTTRCTHGPRRRADSCRADSTTRSTPMRRRSSNARSSSTRQGSRMKHSNRSTSTAPTQWQATTGHS